MIRINRRTAVSSHDLMMVALAWECAWLARANLYAALFTWKPPVASFVIALATQAVVFWRIGLYRGLALRQPAGSVEHHSRRGLWHRVHRRLPVHPLPSAVVGNLPPDVTATDVPARILKIGQHA